jgi:hypothetical protein
MFTTTFSLPLPQWCKFLPSSRKPLISLLLWDQLDYVVKILEYIIVLNLQILKSFIIEF